MSQSILALYMGIKRQGTQSRKSDDDKVLFECLGMI